MSELIGTMTDGRDRHVEVATTAGCVFIKVTPWVGATAGFIALPAPELLAEFRELLDRAAMPGQVPPVAEVGPCPEVADGEHRAFGASLACELCGAPNPGPTGPTAEQPATEADATDPFGGHEFAYESATDLFRCTRCRAYEVTARNDDGITQCPGDLPGEPMELNAY